MHNKWQSLPQWFIVNKLSFSANNTIRNILGNPKDKVNGKASQASIKYIAVVAAILNIYVGKTIYCKYAAHLITSENVKLIGRTSF